MAKEDKKKKPRPFNRFDDGKTPRASEQMGRNPYSSLNMPLGEALRSSPLSPGFEERALKYGAFERRKARQAALRSKLSRQRDRKAGER
jgi:hypothetical protein